jgi:hypothetical protein
MQFGELGLAAQSEPGAVANGSISAGPTIRLSCHFECRTTNPVALTLSYFPNLPIPQIVLNTERPLYRCATTTLDHPPDPKGKDRPEQG